jgi:hypothetical protein
VLTSGGFVLSGKNLEMTLVNDSDALVIITGIYVDWPDTPESQSLSEIRFNNVVLLVADDPLPPSDYPTERNWMAAQSDLELAASESKLLVLLFSDDLQANGYSVNVTFDNGCTVGGSN